MPSSATFATLLFFISLGFARQLSKDVIDSFDEADINGDGKLSFEELTDVEDTPDARAKFADIDADGDGFITVKDLSDAVNRGDFEWCLICCCNSLTVSDDAAFAAEQLEIEELRDEVEDLMKDETDDEGKKCAAHSDCPPDVPFCYDGQYGGECDLCSECQFCQDGVDGTCGNCGSGYPTFQQGQCQKGKKCAAHSDCPPDSPFCYADESGGECYLCSECQFCQDGIDGTCGNCGSGYPIIEEGPCQKRDAAEQRSNYAAASEVSEDLVDSFNDADINGDGKLSFEELTDVEDTPGNRAVFAAIDGDGDGYVTIGDVSLMKDAADNVRLGDYLCDYPYAYCFLDMFCCLGAESASASAVAESDAAKELRGEIEDLKEEIGLLRKSKK